MLLQPCFQISEMKFLILILIIFDILFIISELILWILGRSENSWVQISIGLVILLALVRVQYLLFRKMLEERFLESKNSNEDSIKED